MPEVEEMSRRTRIVNLSLPLEIYEKVEKLADLKGVSKSEILREALKRYIASEIRWLQIRKWGEETAEKLGIKDEDVDRLIHELREESFR